MITDAQLQKFCDDVLAMRREYNCKHGYGDAGSMTFTRGGKYARIIKEDEQHSVFCFVDLATGSILKAAGWNAPAKGARGHIDNGARDVGPYGAAYKR
jgi:hypothetical protein